MNEAGSPANYSKYNMASSTSGDRAVLLIQQGDRQLSNQQVHGLYSEGEAWTKGKAGVQNVKVYGSLRDMECWVEKSECWGQR